MQIPIQNIYYLLCYAWNKLDESDIVDVRAIDSNELIDLFAKVLSNGISRLLKQGLDKYYLEHTESVLGIKGKLHLSETLKQNVLPLKRTVCIYDEFDYNVLHNQILKTIINKLLHSKKLDSSIKDDLHKVYLKLPPISEIRIRNSHFNQIKLHRNNSHYDFLLKICKIIYENLFIDETTGTYKFRDFIRDEKSMAYLFEAFVRNFYKFETDFYISSDLIKWKLVPENLKDLEILPAMFTDITLLSIDRKIIIDTKYYKEAFQFRYDTQKIKSSNLYQLFAYIKNQENDLELTKNCEGVLLYPSIHNDFEYTFKNDNHKIKIISINLNQDWKKIRSDLLKIVT